MVGIDSGFWLCQSSMLMSMNPLPPQAYTKDALQKAYAWLMNQPASIRELATTPDILVSLFLKTQRDGMETLERPSIKNFRSELKQLAGMMSEFSGHESIVTTPHQTISHEQATAKVAQQMLHHNIQPPPTPPLPMAPQQVHGHMSQPIPAPLMTELISGKNSLSAENQKMIQEVKEKLGLPQDQHALDALIRVGYHNLVARNFKP
jgi:hypothetical protein